VKNPNDMCHLPGFVRVKNPGGGKGGCDTLRRGEKFLEDFGEKKI
jgi:hypothetical protein